MRALHGDLRALVGQLLPRVAQGAGEGRILQVVGEQPKVAVRDLPEAVEHFWTVVEEFQTVCADLQRSRAKIPPMRISANPK